MLPDDRERFAGARVARLATTDGERPRLVPVVFALAGDLVYTAVDGKPKRTRELRRLADIRSHPAVSVLVDHYTEDWSTLWWVRADGMASVVDAASDAGHAGIDALRQKYLQYRDDPPAGPVIVIEVGSWRSWRFDG